MRLLKAIVYSNIWIALGASSYALHSMLIADLDLNFPFLILVFFATLFSYNFQRLIRLDIIENKMSERLIWMEKHKIALKYLTFTAFFLALFFTFYLLTLKEIYLAVPAFVLVVFYASFFNQKKNGLRDLPFLKIFIISAVWAYVLGVFPLLLDGETDLVWLVFADKFCFILAITIPFDIRDLSFDKEKQKTLPMLLGVDGAKILAVLLLLTSLYINQTFSTNDFMLIVFYILSLLIVLISNKNRPELYFSGMIDGLLVLSPLLFFF